jgi:hypothetical protein
MTSFNITNARSFLEKLHEEKDDFVASHCLSARHALNAIITAYHLHEWVWGECLKERPGLIDEWGLQKRKCPKDFANYLADTFCPALVDARLVVNGTKHFGLGKISTGAHQGAFQRNTFQADAFDVSYLWIERGGKQQKAEEFIKELVDFWDGFFAKYAL